MTVPEEDQARIVIGQLLIEFQSKIYDNVIGKRAHFLNYRIEDMEKKTKSL